MLDQVDVVGYASALGEPVFTGMFPRCVKSAKLDLLEYACVTPGDSHLLSLTLKADVDPALPQAAMGLCLGQWSELLGSQTWARPIYGLSVPGLAFDTVVAFAPGTHRAHQRPAEIHQRVFALGVAYHWEVPQRASKAEASTLRSLVKFVDFERRPSAIVRMAYRADGGATVGHTRALAKEEQLRSALQRLRGDPTGHVSAENCAATVATLVWRGDRYEVSIDGHQKDILTAGLDDWLEEFLKAAVDPASARTGAAQDGRSFRSLEPQATLETEDGVVADGLVEWQLAEELARLGANGTNRFAVLRFGPQRYIQAYANPDGTFDLEYRNGSGADHFRSSHPASQQEMIETFVRYGRREDFMTGRTWELMRLP